MPTYVTLFRYTAEGFQDLSEAQRQQQIRLIEPHSGQVKAAYGLEFIPIKPLVATV